MYASNLKSAVYRLLMLVIFILSVLFWLGHARISTIADTFPILIKGFGVNLGLSVIIMVLSTVFGVFAGLGELSKNAPVRWTVIGLVQLARNAPWLVTVFFIMFALPFNFDILGIRVPFPGWLKLTVALAIPGAANIAEIVRGAVQSVVTTQWEAAESLGFSRRRTFWKIILPQAYKRMLPPWVNVYSIITMGTALGSIVGVDELLLATQQTIEINRMQPSMLLPMYGVSLVLFFCYLYPISLLSRNLERRFTLR